MSRMGRNSLLMLVIGVLIAGFSVAAIAAEEGGDEGGTVASTTTTIDSGLSPAVSVDTEEPAVAQTDWTYRYIVPTGIALAAIIVLLTAVKYFTDVVRKRYRTLE